MKCPECGSGKARRQCWRRENQRICGLCRASIRDPECGDCVHYEEALQHARERVLKPDGPERHYLAEISPEIQERVNDALAIAQKGNPKRAMDMLAPLLADHPLSHDLHYAIGTIPWSRANRPRPSDGSTRPSKFSPTSWRPITTRRPPTGSWEIQRIFSAVTGRWWKSASAAIPMSKMPVHF